MFKFLKPQLSAVLLLASMFCSAESLAQAALPQAAGAKPWLNLGRAATDAEVKAWDIDVRADFVGLPKGAGSVSKGEEVWEAKCASCHGTFGESNEVFTPIVGGTTKKDIEVGLVANLTRPDFPQRTTMMKLSTLSTLWDYINRAMPWNARKSLKGRPDVQGELCMNNCKVSAEVASILPEFARNAHGNIAEQNRLVGPSRGADTTKPPLQEPLKVAIASGAAQAPKLAVAAPKSALTLAKEQNCLACHGVEQKMVGPAFREIAARYKGNMKAEATLVSRISQGGSGNWGQIPMPAQPQVSSEDLKTLARWILEGAK